MTQDHFDVAIVGGGIVALTSAIECAQRNISIALVHRDLPGSASNAAAGMLAPSIEPSSGAAGAFAFAARDMYPEFIAETEASTRATVPFDLNGILELVGAEDLIHASGPQRGTVISPRDLRSLEPGLRFVKESWALLHPQDGWVDNVVLMSALWKRVRQLSRIREIETAVRRLDFERGEVRIKLENGATISSAKVVLAAGAWTKLIEGLPRPIPLQPQRGQMLAVESVALHHVLIGATGYTVPRLGGVALLGSTMEDAGFDLATTGEGVSQIRQAASEISPTLAEAVEMKRWAGFRPVTPDMLPIVGADPIQPEAIYACGHSRNGILLGPLTGRCIGALVAEADPGLDLGAFRVERFELSSAARDMANSQ